MNKKPKTHATPLCALMHSYGADKCPQIRHGYSPLYYQLLQDQKETAKQILEIGIGTVPVMKRIVGETYVPGASLKAWRDFFPQAQVWGLDKARSVLFEEDRIKCYYVDQSSEHSLGAAIQRIAHEVGQPMEYDLILDDGSHIKEHQWLTIHKLHPHVKPGGFYIIEDIHIDSLPIFADLKLPGFKVEHVYVGMTKWDNFVAYKKEQP